MEKKQANKNAQKINTTQGWFFENVSTTDKTWTRFIKKKRKEGYIRNEKEVTTDTTEIKRIIKRDYVQLHANKLDNLEEINKFLETYNLPTLN